MGIREEVIGVRNDTVYVNKRFTLAPGPSAEDPKNHRIRIPPLFCAMNGLKLILVELSEARGSQGILGFM